MIKGATISIFLKTYLSNSKSMNDIDYCAMSTISINSLLHFCHLQLKLLSSIALNDIPFIGYR